MKRSIRYRFTLIFIGLTALILIVTWGLNTLWLKSFYMLEKVRVLEEAYDQLDAVVMEKWEAGESISDEFQSYSTDDEEPGAVVLRNLYEKSNVTVAIIDSFTGEGIFSSARDKAFMEDRVRSYIFGRNMRDLEVLKKYDNYTIQLTYDQRSKSNYMESWGYFSDNRTIFIMSMPLASITESVWLSNKFLAYVGILTLICGSIIMYFTTKRVVSPILKLANLSERMCELDFEAKYTGTAQDEIGVLGHSMNTLSDKLKDTIGELKSANNELQADIEQKIRIDEMRKDFIANVSHELKTPIALIQGYAEGLTEGMGEDPESRDYYCEVIMDEANKMNKMVKQLLTLTALEFGNDAPVFERFDLTDLIQGILTSADILIQQREARVKFENPGPIYVWADEFKIEEVITNYLNNALNHLDGERRIVIKAETEGGTVRVTVFNTGSRIPEEDIPNLWTKFYKVDKARTREYGGSGIGLSIVKAIMTAHHQECGVRNMEDGVEFWFTLDCGER